MNRKYCLDKKEWERAQAALLLAKRFGLIEDDGIEALEKRRSKKNEEKSLYGVRFYSPPMYLQYELTRFKLDFVQPSEQIKKLGVCPSFTEEEKRAFYENNQDLFGRYHGDLFDNDVRQLDRLVVQICNDLRQQVVYDEKQQCARQLPFHP